MKNDILDEIKKSNKILIIAHEKPDGDAVGSSFAMYHFLKKMNKNVDIVLQDVPETFNYIKELKVIKETSKEKYDLGLVLDCTKKDRLGNNEELLTNCNTIINIDHHSTNNNFGVINHVKPELSSCAEVLYYLFDKDFMLDKTIGECLLTGVLTDTGGFSNDNVLSSTIEMVKELINIGVDFHKVYFNAVSKQTKKQYELANIARERLVFYDNGKIAYTYINKEDLDRIEALPGDYEGIVDIGRNIAGVEVSIFIREDDGYRISLRSNGKVDVSEIATKFNGGGHKMASGCIFKDNLEENKKLLIDEIIQRVNE